MIWNEFEVLVVRPIYSTHFLRIICAFRSGSVRLLVKMYIHRIYVPKTLKEFQIMEFTFHTLKRQRQNTDSIKILE